MDAPYRIYNTSISDYSYVAVNSRISLTTIGKFCSIGPNFLCGWGIHPVNGLSTSPSFYSAQSYNGFSLASKNKIEERKPINIGHDVFIGANVVILDGVNVGNGVIIAAGAVITKDIPDYAIAAGVPASIIKYRFDADIIKKLLSIAWWNWDNEKLKKVEENFFNVGNFITINFN